LVDRSAKYHIKSGYDGSCIETSQPLFTVDTFTFTPDGVTSAIQLSLHMSMLIFGYCSKF